MKSQGLYHAICERWAADRAAVAIEEEARVWTRGDLEALTGEIATALAQAVCGAVGGGITGAVAGLLVFWLLTCLLLAAAVAAVTPRPLLGLALWVARQSALHTAGSACVGLLAAGLALRAPLGLLGVGLGVAVARSAYAHAAWRRGEARLFAHLAQAPVAMISLIGRDHQSIKAAFGTDIQQMPRSLASCQMSIVRHLERLASAYGRRGAAQRLASNRMQRFDGESMTRIFQSGLHEYIQAFVAENNALGAAITDQYLT